MDDRITVGLALIEANAGELLLNSNYIPHRSLHSMLVPVQP